MPQNHSKKTCACLLSAQELAFEGVVFGGSADLYSFVNEATSDVGSRNKIFFISTSCGEVVSSFFMSVSLNGRLEVENDFVDRHNFDSTFGDGSKADCALGF